MKGFKKFLLIYVICFIVLGGVFLFGFSRYMAAFEASQSLPFVKSYMDEELPEGLAACVSQLDGKLTDSERAAEYLKELYDKAQIYKVSDTEYSIRVDNVELGRMLIEECEGKFGFNAWTLAGEEYDLTNFLTHTELSVPTGYTVSINGTVLGEEYIVDTEAEYETFSDMYKEFPELPRLVVYESGAHFDNALVEVRNEKGELVTSLDEKELLANCDEETEAKLTEYVNEYIFRYMTFIGNLDKNIYGNYRYVRELVRDGSSLQRLLSEATLVLDCSPTTDWELLGVEVLLCHELPDGRYVVDICYKTAISQSGGDPVYADNYARFLICSTVSSMPRLVAEGMYNYNP